MRWKAKRSWATTSACSAIGMSFIARVYFSRSRIASVDNFFRSVFVGPIAIVFGVLLSVLGVAFYFGTASASITPLIPTFFGIALILLGVAAFSEKARMHAMHGAALL